MVDMLRSEYRWRLGVFREYLKVGNEQVGREEAPR
jgi:hypothetical protein